MTKESVAYIHVKEYLQERLEIWQDRLSLGHWHIQLVFLDSFREAEDKTDTTPGECEPQWSYLTADIKCYLPMIAGHSDEALDRFVLHELCHCLLAPEQADLKPSQMAVMELSTVMCERALWKAWTQV